MPQGEPIRRGQKTPDIIVHLKASLQALLQIARNCPGVPRGDLWCDNERTSPIHLAASERPVRAQEQLLKALQKKVRKEKS